MKLADKIEHISESDVLNAGREKINKFAIDPAMRAESNSIDAKNVANQAKFIADEAKSISSNTDKRLDNIVAEEMQDAEVIDARKPFGSTAFISLGKRLDAQDDVTAANSQLTRLRNRTLSDVKSVKESVGVHLWQSDSSINFEAAIENVKNLGMGWIRRGIHFNDIFIKSGGNEATDITALVFDFTSYDEIVDRYVRAEIKLILYIEFSATFPKTSQSDADILKCYKNFIVALVRHYSGKGITFETLNEPNLKWITAADRLSRITQYTELARLMGQTVANYDPTGRCFVGNFAAGKDYKTEKDYLESYLPHMQKSCELGLLDYADGISLHPYQLSTAPEEIINGKNKVLDVTKMLINEYSPRKIDIVYTEMGYSSTNLTGVVTLTEEQQAAYDVRCFISHLYAKLDLYIKFNYADQITDGETNQENGFGLLKQDLNTKKKLFCFSKKL